MRVRKKPITVDAHVWFTNGDHPEDKCELIRPVPGDGEPYLSEGKIVRYFRHPSRPGHQRCKECDRPMHNHGWIDTREGGHIVCPGDFIITGVKGEHYPCKPDVFSESYERVE